MGVDSVPRRIAPGSHDPGRQQNSAAREIAHILLEPQSTLPIDGSGTRVVDRDIEDEANCLGAAIPISDEAALRILRDDLDIDTPCGLYKVSAALLRMRINASGAVIRMKRAVHTNALSANHHVTCVMASANRMICREKPSANSCANFGLPAKLGATRTSRRAPVRMEAPRE